MGLWGLGYYVFGGGISDLAENFIMCHNNIMNEEPKSHLTLDEQKNLILSLTALIIHKNPHIRNLLLIVQTMSLVLVYCVMNFFQRQKFNI